MTTDRTGEEGIGRDNKEEEEEEEEPSIRRFRLVFEA
jgi:hypothetical protein